MTVRSGGRAVGLELLAAASSFPVSPVSPFTGLLWARPVPKEPKCVARSRRKEEGLRL